MTARCLRCPILGDRFAQRSPSSRRLATARVSRSSVRLGRRRDCVRSSGSRHHYLTRFPSPPLASSRSGFLRDGRRVLVLVRVASLTDRFRGFALAPRASSRSCGGVRAAVINVDTDVSAPGHRARQPMLSSPGTARVIALGRLVHGITGWPGSRRHRVRQPILGWGSGVSRRTASRPHRFRRGWVRMKHFRSLAGEYSFAAVSSVRLCTPSTDPAPWALRVFRPGAEETSGESNGRRARRTVTWPML